MNKEYARLLIRGMEFARIPEKKRTASFENMMRLVGFLSGEGVSMRVEKGFYSHKFSFGNIYNDFIYASWPDMKDNPALKGVEQTVHQALASAYMAHPFGDEEVQEAVWNSMGHARGDYGMPTGNVPEPYVTDCLSWHAARARFYRESPGTYEWDDDDDGFLPNRRYSDLLLEKEINAAGKQNEYEANRKLRSETALAATFHGEVAAHKGPAIEGYTEEIGGKVCEANFYAYEADMTACERRLNCGSMRSIYSTINRRGEKQYISLDFRHCMMEFHDKTGAHLGEFRFTGQPNSKADSTHDLKCLKDVKP